MSTEYAWMFLAFIFALNISGVGIDYQTEFQMTWLVLSLIGWEISSKFVKRGNDE